MPANLLTVPQVRNAKPDPTKPRRIPDGKGLWLEVRPSGAKFWRYRYKLAGKEQMFTIGEAGEGRGQVSLSGARTARELARDLVRRGIHPKAQREAERTQNIAEGANTFRSVALEWLAENAPQWSAHYTKQVRRGLQKDILPTIGDRPIRSVNSADVLAILKAKKHRPTSAILLQQWMGAVFRYAIANLRADTDPTYAVRGAIVRPKVQHHAPLQVPEIPAFRSALRADTGNRPTVIALELLLLLFVRPVELRAATWAEFDLDGAMWVVPAERMKMGEPHYVPLPKQAVALLRELQTITGNREHLFPNRSDPKRPMDHASLCRLIDRIGYGDKFSPHGFRATASTALNGMHFRPDVIERQLAHAERNQSRAAYNQQAHLAERRQMMQTWADLIDAEVARASKVVPMKAKKSARIAA